MKQRRKKVQSPLRAEIILSAEKVILAVVLIVVLSTFFTGK